MTAVIREAHVQDIGTRSVDERLDAFPNRPIDARIGQVEETPP